ncbi:hypothetical protein [Brevundimonas bullata]|uniref:hypothetical protein n=1 Tax=Brevundimonas bullata TaxID=13160 RepID=UPI002FD9682B
MIGGDKTEHRAAVSMLRDNGVFLTPGQRMGGLGKSVEDLAQRAPILGPAVRGARERARDSFARGAVRQNLAAIGEDLPEHIPAGGEAVEYAAKKLGGEFDRAAAMVPEVALDDQARAAFQRIGAQKTDLPETIASQFDSIIADRLARLDGPVTGEQLRKIESEISTLAARYDGSADGAQQQLGSMLYEVSDELSGLLGRTNPEAGEILGRASEGWAGFTRTRRASAASNSRPFTPGQLSTASRIEDGSVGKGTVAKGNALMQPYARAGQDVMPDAFGNPGTADAVGLGGLAVGAATEPMTTAAIAGGLSVAATPYFMMGRKVLERTAANPTREGIQAAEQELSSLARSDPKVIELTQELRRLYQGSAGVAGGNAPERPRLMTGGR